ncbi:MAG TPA: dynamin family protein [Acidobacteriaceae bacterium]|nr:dynamin family protein [Acidobacteriaceae bacterium]
MDLNAYEESKFELARVLRTVSALLPNEEREPQYCIRELQAKLAEDRFNLVVVGRFSRGKSSLMNAVLGHDWLPTGLVPLTSVITTVTYGTKPGVVLEYQDRGFRSKIELDVLPEYITQAGNPANIKKIRIAEVHLPAEILRRGFFFVDTPGLGSPIAENTRTTESFLPEADAFLLITGYESPLSEDEARFLRGVSSSARRVFVILNKHDTVDAEQRMQALAYVEQQLRILFEHDLPSIFSISARVGLEAKRKQNSQLLDQSGLPQLEDALVQFLLTEKSTEFLLQMCNRTADLILDLGSSAELLQALQRVNALKIKLSEGKPDTYRYISAGVASAAATTLSQKFRPCEICESIQNHSFKFLSRYQYELATNPETQREHAEQGGFCSLHTWQYESIASPQGTCSGYPALLNHLANSLAKAASSPITAESAQALIEGLLATSVTCPLCRLRTKVEAEAVAAVTHRLVSSTNGQLSLLSAICLVHLRLLIGRFSDSRLLKQLLERESLLLRRIAEDMQRYSLKHEALRRHLASDEERDAALKALLALVGHRSVSSPWRVDYIL